jgi:hypothetical protein
MCHFGGGKNKARKIKNCESMKLSRVGLVKEHKNTSN